MTNEEIKKEVSPLTDGPLTDVSPGFVRSAWVPFGAGMRLCTVFTFTFMPVASIAIMKGLEDEQRALGEAIERIHEGLRKKETEV